MKIDERRLRLGHRFFLSMAAGIACVLTDPVQPLHPQEPDTTAAAPVFPAERLAGEYGLWVGERDGRVEVRWITREDGPGFLQVTAGGHVVADTVTPAALAHAVAFDRPRSGDLVLHYGGLQHPADRHRTVIALDVRRASVRERAPDSLFVVGDVHGEFDTLTALLRNAGILDADLGWAAGGAHLVFLGDLMDRGHDVIRLLWYVYGLERQARQAGGRVHVVLGNHEIMVMLADLRYVAPKELHVAELHGISYDRLFDVRHSVLGRWLGSRPAILRIGDVLLAHGGVSSDYLPYRLREYDDSLAAFMGGELFYRWADPEAVIEMDSASYERRIDFFFGETSPFWYREYALTDTLEAALSRVLRRFGSRVHVVAHTPVPGIAERYGGSLIPVHPPRPATELLLLERDGRSWRRYRYGLEGPPIPF